MKWYKLLSNSVRFQMTSATPEDMLTEIAKSGIALLDIRFENDLTVNCTVARKDYRRLEQLILRKGGVIRAQKHAGIYFVLRNLRSRAVLILGMLSILTFATCLPRHVFFIEVNGNKSVPDSLILEKAEECGLKFGSLRRQIRSEVIKNYLLAEIADLQWAGVNTSGCTAVITIKERTEIEEKPNSEICNIVAAKDGVITRCMVWQGNALCKEGDVVKSGQVLVSGYTDYGIAMGAEHANAEIFAQTLYDLRAVAPQNSMLRGAAYCIDKKYSLIIGKKIINLSLDSGIPDSTCVKIYERDFITLPGGFRLPVGVVCEKLIYTDMSQSVGDISMHSDWIKKYAEQYLMNQMVAGQIVDSHYNIVSGQDVSVLTGSCNCIEMIGRIQYEEIIKHNGKDS